MATPKKSITKKSSQHHLDHDVADVLFRRFGGVSIYAVCLLILAGCIIWSGVCVAEQIQQYHQDYRTLQDMQRQYRRLQIEYQRLLIEQQTFSATPHIASRAVTQLGMYSPTVEDKLVLKPSGSIYTPVPHSPSQSSSTSGSTSINLLTDGVMP